MRTEIRWGLADFEHRFGRPAAGMWLPETAVNDDVLAALVEEGVGFTILAPYQVVEDVEPGERRCWWCHPDGSGRRIALVLYDGPLSHDVAFGLANSAAQVLVDRAVAAVPDGGLALVATDGETFGHHHSFAERTIAYALAVEAPKRGLGTGPLAEWLARHPPTETAPVRESAWSCAHGVGRWKADCGCSTGGRPGSTQAWRAPLRAALDLLRDAAASRCSSAAAPTCSAIRGRRATPTSDVVLGQVAPEAFVDEHGWPDADVGDRAHAARAAAPCLLMYTSCGWFFHDLAGLETVQILRYAARALDLLGELGEQPPVGGLPGAARRGPQQRATRRARAARCGSATW